MNKANARLIGFLSKAVLKINRENTDKIRLFCYLMTQKVISHICHLFLSRHYAHVL